MPTPTCQHLSGACRPDDKSVQWSSYFANQEMKGSTGQEFTRPLFVAAMVLFIEAKVACGPASLDLPCGPASSLLAAPSTRVLAWIWAARSHQPGGGAFRRHRCGDDRPPVVRGAGSALVGRFRRHGRIWGGISSRTRSRMRSGRGPPDRTP